MTPNSTWLLYPIDISPSTLINAFNSIAPIPSNGIYPIVIEGISDLNFALISLFTSAEAIINAF